MKNIYTFLSLSVIVLLCSCSSSRTYTQSYDPGTEYYTPESQDITYQQFYDGLSPYGNWVDYRDYGYVWMPYEHGFRPYYNNGRWVYTNYGWTWVSNYNWGWAPFHYGRWLYDDAYGWMWLPGYEWAPAWVSWRSGNGCYGWAPLGPGLNFDINMGSRIPDNYWAFVPHRYINSPRMNNYYITREKNITIINNSTIINNTNITNNKTVYVTGPSALEVEKVTHDKIRPVRIIQKNTPGNTQVSGSAVSIYKPAIRETPQQNQQIRPSKIVKLNDVKVRRENAGAVQNEIPVREGQGKPVTPVDTKPEPAFNRQRINNISAADEKTDRIIKKTNPVIENQGRAQQPEKVIPVQQVPDFKPVNIARDKNNDPQTRNAQQNNTFNEQAPVNNQPSKVRVTNLPNRNSENTREDASSIPGNRQPVKSQQINTERWQHIPSSGDNQLNRSPVNHSPVIRNQNPVEPREGRREFPIKERK